MIKFYDFQNKDNKVGSFFVSSPFILNRSLRNSLIVIIEYNQTIISAVRINKVRVPKEMRFSYRLHDGGPLERESIVLFHDSKTVSENSIKIADDIFYVDCVEDSLDFHPERYFIVSGYISWVYDDFIKELKNTEWIPVEASDKLIFDAPVITRWYDAYRSIGMHPQFIHPGLVARS